MPTEKKTNIGGGNEVSSLEANRAHGPWLIGGSLWILVVRDVGTDDVVQAFEQSGADPTGAWVKRGGDQVLHGNSANGVVSAIGDPTTELIYVAFGKSDTSDYQLHEFDTTTDSWSVTNQAIDTGIPGSKAPVNHMIDIAIIEAATRALVVCYQGATKTVMGSSFETPEAATRDLAGTVWTNSIGLDAGGEINFLVPVIAPGSTKAHICWVDDLATSAAKAYGRTLDPADDSLSTEVSIDATGDGPLKSGSMYSYDGGSQFRIRFLFSDTDDLVHIWLAEEDGSGDMNAPTQIKRTTQDVSVVNLTAHVVGIYCPGTDEEIILSSRDVLDQDGAEFAVADAAETPSFPAETSFDTAVGNEWVLLGRMYIVERDGSAFVDVVSEIGENSPLSVTTDYWEIQECPPGDDERALSLVGVGR